MNDLFPALVAGATGFGQGRLADRDWQQAQEQQAWQRGMAEQEFGLRGREAESRMAQAEAMRILAERRFEEVELSAEDRARMADEHRMWYDRFMAGLARDEFDENSYYKRQKEAREQGIYEEDIKRREMDLRMIFEQFQEWTKGAEHRKVMEGLERYNTELDLGLKELQVAAGLYEKEHILPERAEAAQLANDIASMQRFKIDQLLDFQIWLERHIGENEAEMSDADLAQARMTLENLPALIKLQNDALAARTDATRAGAAGTRAQTAATNYMLYREKSGQQGMGELVKMLGDAARQARALAVKENENLGLVSGAEKVKPQIDSDMAYALGEFERIALSTQPGTREHEQAMTQLRLYASWGWDMPEELFEPQMETMGRYGDIYQRGVRMFGGEPLSPSRRLSGTGATTGGVQPGPMFYGTPGRLFGDTTPPGGERIGLGQGLAGIGTALSPTIGIPLQMGARGMREHREHREMPSPGGTIVGIDGSEWRVEAVDGRQITIVSRTGTRRVIGKDRLQKDEAGTWRVKAGTS